MFENYYDVLGKTFGFKEPREIQRKAKQLLKKHHNKNLLVIAGCGSGKTEVGNYALLNWNGKRSIFVEPMRTLATSIQKRLNNYNELLNIEYNWKIQHSGIEEDKYLENKYCVTTIDQVLAGWLGIGRQSFIRGKNVIQSNFIFDEVQLFQPDKALLTTINFLDSIYLQGNRFLIMTATMPKYLIDFLVKRYNMELIESEEETIKERKIYVNYKKELDFNKINSIKERQIIICNTQAQQKYVYENINDKDMCIILNSKLLITDRNKIESDELLYKYFQKDSQENDKILIATSIIEAGVDISANYLYSYGCPIDNFIQRCGRCARWGGIGYIEIIKNDDYIYNREIVKNTLKFFIENPNIEFTWDVQKEVVTDILNPFYATAINEKSIRKNKNDLVDGSRNKLIRDIQNVNIIVDANINEESFKKESISIHIDVLEKLDKTNDLYVLEKRKIQKAKYSEKLIGETIVIEGNDCVYDELGFRYEEGVKCKPFRYYNSLDDKYNRNFIEYKKETWVNHSIAVKTLVKQKILKDKFSNYVMDNCDKISLICGLHDLGKLDQLWQSDKWANAKALPLAHFPFTKGSPTLFKGRNHKFIGGILLKDFVDKTLFNVIIQHHGRVISPQHDIEINEFELHKNYKLSLYELGFNNDVLTKGKDIVISYKDIISPKNKEWNDFLYIVGTLMEADIEAINLYHNQ